MDKVINGVDVSECEYNKGYCRISALCDYSGHICEVDHDCYYKQLKRKEQDCEEWEKLANEANERANDCANDIGKLQEDVRYYKELSKDFDTKLKLAKEVEKLIKIEEMSEVEKMYVLVKVKNKYCCKSSQCIVTNPYPEWCNKCESLIIKYPDFTAEKQLELIKWLAKTRPIHITFLVDKWVIEGMIRYGKRYDTFEDALSGYINNIWQDLTEQERTEIKEILE